MPILNGEGRLDKRMGSPHATVEQANCNVAVTRRRYPIAKLIAPGALFGAAETHEERRGIFGTPEFGHDVAVRDKPIQCCDVG